MLYCGADDFIDNVKVIILTKIEKITLTSK